MLFMPCLYMHFYIEHNFGHHIKVATPDDGQQQNTTKVFIVFGLLQQQNNMVMRGKSKWNF